MHLVHLTVPGYPEATVEGYVLDCEITFGQEKDRPAIVICPGGGYLYCSPREAEPVALRYAACGFHTFILRYSTGRAAANFAPLTQINWLIGYLREHAQQLHIHPQKIVTCGFSAGGHLALAAGVMAENRPNAMILGYPAVVLPNIPGADFLLKLLTGKQEITEADEAQLNLSTKIAPQSPPVFLVATAEDVLTRDGALLVANRYCELGRDYELHIYQHGPHGYSLATDTSADGSSQMLNPAFAQWQPLSVQWLHKIFGAPEFVNRSTSKMGIYLKELGYEMPGQSEDATHFA